MLVPVIHMKEAGVGGAIAKSSGAFIWTLLALGVTALSPLAADVRTGADQIADWCHTKSIEFLNFSGDFVLRFFQNHA